MEGFLRYRIGGWVYIWRGLFTEFYGMLVEFCAESLVWVSERGLMVRVSSLNRVLSKAYMAIAPVCSFSVP